MIEIVLHFLLGTVFSAACFWGAMKLTRIDGTFLGMFLIAAISSLVALIPVVGWLAGIVVMFVLISKWTNAQFWPHAVFMVLVANLLGILGSMALAGLLNSV